MIQTGEKTAARIAEETRHEAARLYAVANSLIELAELLEGARKKTAARGDSPTTRTAGGTR